MDSLICGIKLAQTIDFNQLSTTYLAQAQLQTQSNHSHTINRQYYQNQPSFSPFLKRPTFLFSEQDLPWLMRSYKIIIPMQFPQINKYESLIERHLRPSFDPLYALSFDAEPLPRQQITDLLSDIEQINLARSYHPQPTLSKQQNTPTSPHCAIKSTGSEQTHECDRDLTFFSQRKNKRNTGRSLIFTQINFSKHKDHPGQKSIRVYYFNLPTSKMIAFDGSTTVADLIRFALEAYTHDKQLDASSVRDRTLQNYELRIPQKEDSHVADMSIQPISPSRVLADNLLDSLVLLKKELPSSRKMPFQPIEYVSTSNTSAGGMTIILFNELGQQLGQVSMLRSDSLEKVLSYIETNDLHQMRNYFLTENQNDEDPLPKDFQIKNLQSNRIYLKSKRFIDESEFEGGNRAKIIRGLTLFKKEEPLLPAATSLPIPAATSLPIPASTSLPIPASTSLPIHASTSLPIGLSEASLYQQFSVIKVNNLGVEQQRIIGIDQHKLYNYDRAVRQQKKQTSFLSKIFGINKETGTKRPYRFITDVQQLTHIERGFQLAFPDKAIKYYVNNVQTRERIIRKLNYLISYTQGQKGK